MPVLFRMGVWMSFDALRLVIDGFSEMSFSIGICSWWFIVLHLLLIVVGGDWLSYLLGEGGVEGQAFLSGDVHEDVEGGWFPMLAELVRIWRDSRETKMNLRYD